MMEGVEMKMNVSLNFISVDRMFLVIKKEY